jgi:hypothetical protein
LKGLEAAIWRLAPILAVRSTAGVGLTNWALVAIGKSMSRPCKTGGNLNFENTIDCNLLGNKIVREIVCLNPLFVF